MPNIEGLLPQSPMEGPPLPARFRIKWPWSPFHVCMSQCMMGTPMIAGKLVTPQVKFAYCAKECKGQRTKY